MSNYSQALDALATPAAAKCCIAIASVVALQFITSLRVSVLENDKLHVRRKIQHLSSGLLIAYLGEFVLPAHFAVLCIAVSLAIYSLILYLRFIPAVDRRFVSAFGPLMRDHELKGAWPGAFFFLLSTLFCCVHVHMTLACLAIAYVSVGDPMAALCGQLWGRSTRCLPRGKSLVGAAACVTQ